MKMKKIWTLLLILAVLLVSFTACDRGTPKDTDPGVDSSSNSNSDSSSSTQAPQDDGQGTADIHNIIKDGTVQYAVVRPDTAETTLINAAKSLYNAIRELSTDKDSAEFNTDMTVEYLKTGVHDKDAKEILVGVTNYAETEEAMLGLGYGDYVIKTVGNKIIIAGWSDEATAKGVERFINYLTSAEDKSNLSLKASDIAAQGNCIKAFDGLPTYDFDGTELKGTYYGGEDCYTTLLKNATKDTHTQYLTKLEDAGYKKYAENDMNDNLFATYIKDDIVVNASYYPVKNEARIIVEELGDRVLPSLENENTYTKVCEPMFFQVGVCTDNSSIGYGMCYMFRLEDGSFLIFDGGYMNEISGESTRENARRIYEIMKEYAPDPKNMTVKTWIITHGHSDHIDALRQFVTIYTKYGVTIEQVVENFPTAEQSLSADYSADRVDDMYKNFADFSPNTEFIRIHPGNKLYLAGAEVEFLYTLELYFPNKLTYYNTSSLVCSVTIAGHKFMMTGDMSGDSNSIICRLYGKYLQSDIVQVAHHGYQGGSTQFYTLVDPTWAFWPINRSEYATLKNNARNEYMFKEGTNLKQVFVAFFQTTAVELPFNGTNYTVTDNKSYY